MGLRRPVGALRRPPRGRRPHRRSRRRQGRHAARHGRAGRGHPRQGHDLRRRRARPPHQGADARPAARRAERAGAVCDRPQGAVGRSGGPPGAGHRDPHARLSAARRRSSAAAGSTRCRTGRISHRLRRRPRLPGSAARSVRGVPALQAAPLRGRHPAPAARWCATAPRRCRRAAGTRSRACSWTAA